MANIPGEIVWQANDNTWFTTNAAEVYPAGITIYHVDGRYKFTDGVTALSALSFLGGGSGVQSVTGPQVDDTDPLNPIVDVPTLQEVTDEGATTTNVIEAAGVIADSFVTPLVFSTIYEDGAYFFQGDAANELFNVDNNTDLVTYKEKEIAVIEAAQTTGVALTFLTDSVYGTIGTPETGNITYSATNAKLGVTNLIIHNHSVAPTFAANMKILSGSGAYVINVINYIYVTYINSTEVIYTISQRT